MYSNNQWSGGFMLTLNQASPLFQTFNTLYHEYHFGKMPKGKGNIGVYQSMEPIDKTETLPKIRAFVLTSFDDIVMQDKSNKKVVKLFTEVLASIKQLDAMINSNPSQFQDYKMIYQSEISKLDVLIKNHLFQKNLLKSKL
jgi:hypothetical protein